MKPKSVKELRNMGLDSTFAGLVMDFQKTNQLGSIEILALIQMYQTYVMDMVILVGKEQEGDE